jgi:dehydrogenase/reductase SDR family protein 4
LIKKIEVAHGKLDVLVLNAACSTHFGTQMDITEAAYDKMFSLNVKSPFFTIKESLHLLKKAGKESNILVVSSIGASSPSPHLGVYGMTKAALNNMVQWMSKELMDDDVRINTISPGLVKTEFSGVLWKGNEGIPEKSKGTAEQIASVAALMCSKEGAFINGVDFIVHGGFARL